MIQVFTLGQPDPKLKFYGKSIANLNKGAYNLPYPDPKHQTLFDKLYVLGVRQIIHDGSSKEIHCLDGHTYATTLSLGQTPGSKEVLIIKI